MFNDYGSKPTRVNLSGSKFASSGNGRDAFKANIQRQRAAREKLQQRNLAACSIQSFFRRYEASNTIKNRFRDSLDKDLSSYDLDSSQLSNLQLSFILRRLVFIASSPNSLVDFRFLTSRGSPVERTISIRESSNKASLSSTQNERVLSSLSSHLIRNVKGVTSPHVRPAVDPILPRKTLSPQVVLDRIKYRCVWLNSSDVIRLRIVLSIVNGFCFPPTDFPQRFTSVFFSLMKIVHIALSHCHFLPECDSLQVNSLVLLSRLMTVYPDHCVELFVKISGEQLLYRLPKSTRNPISADILTSSQNSSPKSREALLTSFIRRSLWVPQLGYSLESIFLSGNLSSVTELKNRISQSIVQNTIATKSSIDLPLDYLLFLFYSSYRSSVCDPSAVDRLHSFVKLLDSNEIFFPFSSILILDVLISSILTSTLDRELSSSPCPKFVSVIETLVQPSTLQRFSLSLSKIPKSHIPSSLISLFRIFIPVQVSHPWLCATSLLGNSRYDYFEARLASDEVSNDDDELLPDDHSDCFPSTTTQDRRSLDSYLEDICARPSERVPLFSDTVLRHFANDNVTISLLISCVFANNANDTAIDINQLIKQVFQSYSLEVLVQILTSLIVLLEYRSSHSASADDNEWRLDQEEVGGDSASRDNGTNVLNYSSVINMINRIAVTLLERPTRSLLRSDLSLLNSSTSMKDHSTLILHSIPIISQSLRDLHRLRPSTLRDEDWLVQTPILKPTAVLLDYLESFMTRRHEVDSSFDNQSVRLVDSAILPFPHAKETLALLLTFLPHTLRLSDRMLLFQFIVIEDRIKLLGDFTNPFLVRDSPSVEIRRSQIVEDALSISQSKIPLSRMPIRVTFLDDDGLEETGVDAGGLFREFVILLSRRLFSPEFGLFCEVPDHSLVPNKKAYSIHRTLCQPLYRLAGNVIGKALYEGILIDAVINQIFISLIQRRETQRQEDLIFLDPEFYRNLQVLRAMADASQLQLTFTVTSEMSDGTFQDVELVEGGKAITVDNSNRDQYIRSVIEFKLVRQFSDEARLVAEGITDVIPLHWLSGFDARELGRIISGEDSAHLDVDDLAANTSFRGGYDPNSQSVQWLWNVLRSFNPQQQRDFLMFVTSCPRAPFLGFRLLHPRFTIHQIESATRLPSANTCLNCLNLPDAYGGQEELRDKLLQALCHAKGFYLS